MIQEGERRRRALSAIREGSKSGRERILSLTPAALFDRRHVGRREKDGDRFLNRRVLVHDHDRHATIYHLLGLYQECLAIRHGGRDYRLTDLESRVVDFIFA